MFDKLLKIQSELKAPKGQYNKFSDFYYRSCEDILEAVKPLLKEQKLVLTLSDKIVLIGERYYVEATADLTDCESKMSIQVKACAREPEIKKGMDSSQITGAASSYARKYALNGLFDIDDTKDADTLPPELPKKEYKCSDCGKPFKDITDKNGKKWTAGQLYHISQKKNPDGKARCSACIKKLEKAGEQ